MKNIAVIGAGISGLAAAYLLSRRHRVQLFEKEARLGGHTNTVLIPTPHGTVPLDTGFLVHNDRTYPNSLRGASLQLVLFMPQRFDRIEGRGPERWPVTGDDADAERRREPRDNRPQRRDRRKAREHQGEQQADAERGGDAGDAANTPTGTPPRAGTGRGPAWRRAPTAIRSPISRVRSVTLMNITLAMPIAPMSRLTPARPAVASPMRALRPSKVAMI